MPYHIKILLVGAGNMSQAYFKVLKALEITPTVLCRSENTAQKFFDETGGQAISGGLNNWLEKNTLDESWKVIIATPVEVLYDNIIELLNHGAKDILVEKPGFISSAEGQNIIELAQKHQAKVHIGYNRRFYASVYALEDFIQKDGGLQSVQFEFTEWGHVIEKIEKGPKVKEHWFLANSTHVVDLVFFIAGIPVDYNFNTSGGLSWHPSASVFVGSGKTDKNVMFSYTSNWEAPGRWAIEFMTNQHRLYLKPMEKLNIQVKGSVAVNEFKIDDSLDIEFKPGIYKMVESFLENDYSRLVPIAKQAEFLNIYNEMANYQ